MDRNTKSAILAAIDVIEQFEIYGQEMRKHGRGFSPTDGYGRTIHSVLAHLCREVGVEPCKFENLEGIEVPMMDDDTRARRLYSRDPNHVHYRVSRID